MGIEYSRKGQIGLLKGSPAPELRERQKIPLELLVPEYQKITLALVELNQSVETALRAVTPAIQIAYQLKPELIEETQGLIKKNNAEIFKFVAEENKKLKTELNKQSKSLLKSSGKIPEFFKDEVEEMIKENRLTRRILTWFKNHLWLGTHRQNPGSP